MTLKYTYTDNRGLRVPDEEIEKLLAIVGKTEDEVAQFLGEDRMMVNGSATYFLDLFATQTEWYKLEECKRYGSWRPGHGAHNSPYYKGDADGT